MVWYVIGFLLDIFGIIYAVYKTFKNKNVISPQIIVMVAILLFLFLPAFVLNSKYLNDAQYNFTIMIGVIGALFAIHIFPYDILDHMEKEKRYEPLILLCQIGTYIYVLYLLIEIGQSIYSAGGVIAAFHVNRLEGYLSGSMLSNSSVGQIITEGLKMLFYFYFAFLISRGEKAKAIFLYCIPMIHHRFTAVTRFDFVAMAGALIVFLVDEKLYIPSNNINDNLEKRKINFFKVFVIGIICAYVALIFMRVSNFTRYGQSASGINLSVGALLNAFVSNDSLYYEYFHRLFSALLNHEIQYEYGMSWLIYPLINFVPRSIWRKKPYTAFSARMTDKLYWRLDSGNPVVTFSSFGEGFAQFGIFGIFICTIVFIGVRWINIKSLKKMKYSNMYILIMIFSMFTYMRSEAPVFLAIIDQLWIILIQKCFSCSNISEPVNK